MSSKSARSYYVYALKDSRQKLPKPFYIGKGTGVRSEDHLLKPDNTPKGKYIQEIVSQGRDVIVVTLADELTETQALKLEAELISAFGIEKRGGMLKNSVIPSGNYKSTSSLNIPQGVYEKAQLGLKFLKDAIFESISSNPKGVKNAELARNLGLQSEHGGKQKDYLTYSVLGLLLGENKIYRDKETNRFRRPKP